METFIHTPINVIDGGRVSSTSNVKITSTSGVGVSLSGSNGLVFAHIEQYPGEDPKLLVFADPEQDEPTHNINLRQFF